MTTTFRTLLLVAVVAVTASCAGYSDPQAVSRRVTEVTGTSYVQVSSTTVGRTAFGIARIATAAADADAPDLIRDLKDVQWATFRADGSSRADALRPLSAADFRGYDPVVVRQAESGEDVLVLSRGGEEEIREILVVIDGHPNLTVVQVRGDLDQILEQVVSLAFGRVERDDLTPETLRSMDQAPGEGG